MVGSLTDSVYLNVRKHRVLCNRTVRLKIALNALLLQPSSMKPVDDRPTLYQATSTTAETHLMSCYLPPNPAL